MIDFSDREKVKQEHPLLLIAHRGGVVGPGAPQCSLEAIRRAAQEDYAMVEIDARVSKDGVPIFFHDATLRALCGDPRSVKDLPAEALCQMKYLDGGDCVATVDAALGLCKSLNLGVQVDIKDDKEDEMSRAMVGRVGELLVKHGLTSAAITISNGPAFIDQALAGKAMFCMSPGTFSELLASGAEIPKDRFIFGSAKDLTDERVKGMLEHGLLVCPTVNTHHYIFEKDLTRTQADIKRLQSLGVTCFQIDSQYRGLIGSK